jgi:Flp pilus assembly protein TadD
MGDDEARRRKGSDSLRLAVFLLLSAGVLQAQEQQGNIAGQIRVVDGSFPSEQIRVTLEARGGVADVTYADFEGRFGFRNLLPNAYWVIVDTEGYQPVRLQVVVNPTTLQTNLIHVVLRPKPGEKSRGAADGLAGTNPDIVDVAELKKKFSPGVIKEYEAGKKAEQHGDLETATTHYLAAIREAPDFYPAHNNLGVRHLRKGELKAAEFEFRRVIELNSNGAQAYFNLGNVLYITKQHEEAKQTLEAGLRLAPSSAMGHYLNGSVLARLGESKAAEEQLKTARELDPKMPQVPITLATLYLQTGRGQEAAAMFQAFLKEFPKDPMVPKVRAALAKMTQSSTP